MTNNHFYSPKKTNSGNVLINITIRMATHTRCTILC